MSGVIFTVGSTCVRCNACKQETADFTFSVMVEIFQRDANWGGYMHFDGEAWQEFLGLYRKHCLQEPGQ